MIARHRIVGSLAAATLALALAACGPTATKTPAATETETTATQTTEPAPTTDSPTSAQGALLDAVVEASQSTIPDIINSYGDTYTDIKVLSDHVDTLIYEYYYAATQDRETLTANLDDSIETLQQSVDESVLPALVGAGITDDPKVTFSYFDADGTLIWTHTFSGS